MSSALFIQNFFISPYSRVCEHTVNAVGFKMIKNTGGKVVDMF
jgi:hypothetical protein